MATVGVADGGGEQATSRIYMDDRSIGMSLWTSSGRGNKLPSIEYSYDAVADAKLTLPLKVGQRVIRRDGKVVEVKRGMAGHIVELGGGGSAVFAATGVCSAGTREAVEASPRTQHYWDAVADAVSNDLVS